MIRGNQSPKAEQVSLEYMSVVVTINLFYNVNKESLCTNPSCPSQILMLPKSPHPLHTQSNQSPSFEILPFSS